MIYEYALDPELVATWHDPRAAFPFVSNMGLGHFRVMSAFPASNWERLVLDAALAQCSTEAQRQAVCTKMSAMLQKLKEGRASRDGVVEGAWIGAAQAEHQAFPFGGIIVRTASTPHAALVVADQLGSWPNPAWSPTAPPVARNAAALADALRPLLGVATEIRFVDPYFVPSDPTFWNPLAQFLTEAIRRRTPGVALEVHVRACNGDRLRQMQQLHPTGGLRTVTDVARFDAKECIARVGQLLGHRTSFRFLVWSENGKEKLHNRYLLTNLGSVAVQSGLDEGPPRSTHTDDLTVLSRDQHLKRWSQYSTPPTAFKLVYEERA
ncbi:hypothetical protein D7W82_22500 [Corallococcus sp. CA049B]|uniref:hypothetical protein n=1 Tax=Corallococcus sp. CA049B TaxID=2316730 RepID=UPI000EA2A2AE|nr:hypothetical protein [Corallococcus sp. CA049B]RKG84395.1 hypothetical protein D7W82_22500 [Corallococcus sp. CA049B]